jgi:hypothetical protein
VYTGASMRSASSLDARSASTTVAAVPQNKRALRERSRSSLVR